MEPLISLIIVLAVVGLILWLVTTYIPMPAPFKTIIMVVVVIAVCIWLLESLGGLGGSGLGLHRL